MFNYTFLTVKYTLESALLCLTLTLLLRNRRKNAWKILLGAWWIWLLSGIMQGVLHYAITFWFGNIIQAETFTLRYILMNAMTMFLFWRVQLKCKPALSAFFASHLLISMQFCQAIGTYVIYAIRKNIQIVTEFGPMEQLPSGMIIILLFLISYFVSSKLSKKIESISVREAVLALLFDWCFFVIGRLMRRFFFQAQLFPYITALLYGLFLVELFSFFAIAMRMIRLRKVAVEEARLAQQYALQMHHADEISALYQDFRRLRHEGKNQEIYLRHLLKTKNYSELERYFDAHVKLTQEYSTKIDSGNQLVNAILWSKTQTAEHESIPVTIAEAAVPGDLPIEGAHLCSVLVNLLDNAIEASRCSKEPEIRVTICMKQDYLFCSVANHVDTDVAANNPEFKTTKRDKRNHGFGIQTVKLIAEQYNGMCDFEVENNTFTATVMLSCGEQAATGL